MQAASPDTGNEINEDEPVETRKGLAVASLLLSILSALSLGLLGILAIIGIILGIIALKKTNLNPAEYGGKNQAIIGIALGGFSLFLSVVVIPLIFAFVAQPVKVEGAAMKPTLNDGDRIFIWKQIENIKRGDIVVFWYPEDPSKSFVKRVIGLPGETIDMDSTGRITINGLPIDEPYVPPAANQHPRERWAQTAGLPERKYIKPHYYFVMGDNRDASNDSRSWGLVPEKYIYGKLFARYLSAD